MGIVGVLLDGIGPEFDYRGLADGKHHIAHTFAINRVDFAIFIVDQCRNRCRYIALLCGRRIGKMLVNGVGAAVEA